MNSKGYMRISRDIENWGWYRDSNTFRVFFHLLLRAQYQDSEYMGVKILRGQVATGRKQLSADLGISEQGIRTAIDHLIKSGEINQQSTNKFSVITICKFDNWQCLTKSDNQQINQQLTNNQPAAEDENNHIQRIKELEEIIEQLTKEKEELAKASKKKENEDSVPELKDQFDIFRVKYKQYGGKVRGLDTELDNLKKHHKDWKDIIPLLLGALDKENQERQKAKAKGAFFPLMKNLQTYINNRSWEAYPEDQATESRNEYMPIADGIYQRWNSAKNCLEVNSPYFNMWNDGYNEDNRPDGARVAYQQYMWKWDSKTKQWVEQNYD